MIAGFACQDRDFEEARLEELFEDDRAKIASGLHPVRSTEMSIGWRYLRPLTLLF